MCDYPGLIKAGDRYLGLIKAWDLSGLIKAWDFDLGLFRGLGRLWSPLHSLFIKMGL